MFEAALTILFSCNRVIFLKQTYEHKMITNIGRAMQRRVFGHMRTAKAKISAFAQRLDATHMFIPF